jgi:hypothetical protein
MSPFLESKSKLSKFKSSQASGNDMTTYSVNQFVTCVTDSLMLFVLVVVFNSFRFKKINCKLIKKRFKFLRRGFKN